VYTHSLRYYPKTGETEAAGIWHFEENANHDGITYRDAPGFPAPPNGAQVFIEYIPADMSGF
jgi:hypothetical protein